MTTTAGSVSFKKEKRCGKCHLVKPAEEFHKSFGSADFLAGYCKECAVANTKAYMQANKEKYRKYQKARYQERKRVFKELEAEATRRGVEVSEVLAELSLRADGSVRVQNRVSMEDVKAFLNKEPVGEKSFEQLLEESDWEESPG